MPLFNADKARKQFCRAPIGIWESYLGGGHDMHTWIKLIFREDGTGLIEERGFDHQYDPGYVSEPRLFWKTVDLRTIEITHRGDTRRVSYDFKSTENEYQIKELRMFEVGRTPDEYGDHGFWISPFSLVYRGQASPTGGKA